MNELPPLPENCSTAFDVWWSALYPSIPTPIRGPYDIWAAAWSAAIEAHEARKAEKRLTGLILPTHFDPLTGTGIQDPTTFGASAPPAPQASVVKQEPVARLMVWQGPKHQPVPFGGVCARTFSEFPKESADDPKSYWKNGENLYTHPAPVREPTQGVLVTSSPDSEVRDCVVHPEPVREPLTDEQIEASSPADFKEHHYF